MNTFTNSIPAGNLHVRQFLIEKDKLFKCISHSRIFQTNDKPQSHLMILDLSPTANDRQHWCWWWNVLATA